MRGFAAISLAWFFFMGGLGLFMPFYSLFLHENLALSGSQVGLACFAPPLMPAAMALTLAVTAGLGRSAFALRTSPPRRLARTASPRPLPATDPVARPCCPPGPRPRVD